MYVAEVTSKTERFGSVEGEDAAAIASKVAPERFVQIAGACADLKHGKVEGWPAIVDIGGGRYLEIRLREEAVR